MKILSMIAMILGFTYTTSGVATGAATDIAVSSTVSVTAEDCAALFPIGSSEYIRCMKKVKE